MRLTLGTAQDKLQNGIYVELLDFGFISEKFNVFFSHFHNVSQLPNVQFEVIWPKSYLST